MDFDFLKNEKVIYDALPKIHCYFGGFGCDWGMFAFVDFLERRKPLRWI